MRTINFTTQQFDEALLLKSGGFTYRVDYKWAEIPEKYMEYAISSSCVGPGGELYVTTRIPETPVLVFSKEGKLQGEIHSREIKRPHGVNMTSKGTLLITDDDGHAVYELSLDGEVLLKIGSGQPSDTGYNRGIIDELKKQYPGLEIRKPLFLKVITDTVERSAGPFNHPTETLEDENGLLFTADGYGNARIHCFSARGELMYSFGEPGTEPGQFRVAHGLALDPLGRLWASDRENSRVQIFSRQGELIACSTCFTKRPAEVWCAKDHAFVAEIDGGISVVDMELHIVARLGYDLHNFRCHGITGDAQENLYITTLAYADKNLIKLERVE